MKEYGDIRDGLLAKGYPMSKINGNYQFILDILEIISEDEEGTKAIQFVKALMDRYHEINETLDEELSEVRHREDMCSVREAEIKEREERCENLESGFREVRTDEAWDRLVVAEYYRQNVKIRDGFDNQRFITGLSRILSGQKVEDVNDVNMQ